MKGLEQANTAIGIKITIGLALFGGAMAMFDDAGPGINFSRNGFWVVTGLVLLGLSVLAGLGAIQKGAGLKGAVHPPQRPTDNAAFKGFWRGQILFLFLGGAALVLAAVI